MMETERDNGSDGNKSGVGDGNEGNSGNSVIMKMEVTETEIEIIKEAMEMVMMEIKVA